MNQKQKEVTPSIRVSEARIVLVCKQCGLKYGMDEPDVPRPCSHIKNEVELNRVCWLMEQWYAKPVLNALVNVMMTAGAIENDSTDDRLFPPFPFEIRIDAKR